MAGDDPRTTIAALARSQGVSLSELSRALGRNPAYVQQYIERGTPRRLAEQDRAVLARYLGVSEALLGGPVRPALIPVSRIDARASAGPGGLVEDDREDAPLKLDEALLRELRVRPGDASMIEVAGDSMEPTLSHGDAILVDRADRRGAAGAIHVLRHDGVLQVKRIGREAGAVRLLSDNPAYPPITVPDPAAIEVLGRVVWLSRRL